MGDCNWRIWRKHVKKDLQNIFRVQFWGQFEACKQKWWKLNYSFFLLIHYALLFNLAIFKPREQKMIEFWMDFHHLWKLIKVFFNMIIFIRTLKLKPHFPPKSFELGDLTWRQFGGVGGAGGAVFSPNVVARQPSAILGPFQCRNRKAIEASLKT
jgi:hypothetical protein